jgi:hypothetical protein
VVRAKRDKKKQYNIFIFEKTFNRKKGNEIKTSQLFRIQFRLMKLGVQSSECSGCYMEIIPLVQGDSTSGSGASLLKHNHLTAYKKATLLPKSET